MVSSRLLAALAVVLLVGAPRTAAQTCTPIEIAWPDAADPVWELTALPPSLSTPSWPGSGLEIRDVKYRGTSVLKRGHIPMVNVKYDHGTCFRDWMTSNTRFEASNQTGTCFAEPPAGTVQTVCDTGVGMPDIGTFRGIAMEDFGDGFTLTSQSQAGWYRYTIKWTFEVDGTIRPEFGFSHTSSSMADNPRRHHVYWRLDFDIETAENNYIAVSRNGERWRPIETETTQFWDDPAEAVAPTSWGIFNHDSGRGYRLTPGPKEYLTPANPGTGVPEIDEFAKEDIAFSRYRPGQLTDGAPGCAVDFFHGSNPIVQEEEIASADIVVWYRTGATRLGGNGPDAQDTCQPLGPVLHALGDWGAPIVGTEQDAPRDELVLEAFPNPFDHTTTVRFSLDDPQQVRVTLYDGLGREVRLIYEGSATAATHELRLDASDLPNGIYTVRLAGEAGAEASRRIVLVR